MNYGDGNCKVVDGGLEIGDWGKSGAGGLGAGGVLIVDKSPRGRRLRRFMLHGTMRSWFMRLIAVLQSSPASEGLWRMACTNLHRGVSLQISEIPGQR